MIFSLDMPHILPLDSNREEKTAKTIQSDMSLSWFNGFGVMVYTGRTSMSRYWLQLPNLSSWMENAFPFRTTGQKSELTIQWRNYSSNLQENLQTWVGHKTLFLRTIWHKLICAIALLTTISLCRNIFSIRFVDQWWPLPIPCQQQESWAMIFLLDMPHILPLT